MTRGSPVDRALAFVRARSSGSPVAPAHRVTLNFHPDIAVDGVSTIERLGREGVYRSQFETGTSNGGLTAYPGGDRWAWESRIFGGAYDCCADASLRPKYGALNLRADPVGGSRRFGSAHLRLRPTVLARTSFCFPDSHFEPTLFGTGDRMPPVDLLAAGLDDPLDRYVEAHVHGPLRLADDVEAVVLDPSYRGTAVERAARKLPCAIKWHAGFRLPLGRLAECERYRNARAATVLAAIAQDGSVTPHEIGVARRNGLDDQSAKWAWHCVARFGGRPFEGDVRPGQVGSIG